MIGKLSGRIEYKSDDHLLLDVRGVGYIVFCSDRTLMALPGVGEFTALYTDLVVREDLMQLFGFLTLVEKEWHRLLLSVQGVGAKASLAILGALGPDGVSKAIALGDWTSVKAAKGIGPKTAQRVVNELKDKAPKVMAMAGNVPASVDQSTDPGAVIEPIAAARPDLQTAARTGNPAAQAEALSGL
ncbi:MAG: Holliday junction branch migration protein RuvA, partial [Paracoccaceae bacterium]